MTEVRFGTYNLLNYEGADTAGDRYAKVVDTIRSLDLHVLAVQEVLAPDERTAGKVLAELGDDVGLTCWYSPGQPAVALGHKLSARDICFNVGLLWRPEIEPVRGRFRAFSEDFWHGLALGVFDLGGVHVAMGSFHATPFGRNMREDQAERVVSALTRPDSRPPGLVAGDWNGISADIRNDGSGPYDHDWHVNESWYPDLVYQTRWQVQNNALTHWADRGPGEVLYYGGLRDAAAVLDAPWEATVGYWPSEDPFGNRRIDAIKATHDMVPSLQRLETVRTDLSVSASDHLPVVLSFDPALISHDS